MQVMVTGGAGFIGLWIIRRLLARGMKVRVFDRVLNRGLADALLGEDAEGVDWRTGDVSDGAAMRECAEGCDLVVHLAAILTPDCAADPIRGAEINLIGHLNAFEAARAHGIDTVLYMSSAGVYGPDDGAVPAPTTHYGAFKLAGEGCARAYWEDAGISSTGFRPFVVYGPGRETGMTAGPTLACRAAVRGEAYTIPVSGETDFVFVDDVAAAYEAAADDGFKGARVFNVTTEMASIARFVEEIKRHVNDARIDIDGPVIPIAPGIDEGDLRAVFPGVPRTGIAEGVERTIDFYRRQGWSPRPDRPG